MEVIDGSYGLTIVPVICLTNRQEENFGAYIPSIDG
jgi:hypothetical protein